MKLGVVASAKQNKGFKAALGNGASTTSNTTVALTLTAAVAIGDLVVVRWAADNLSATTPTATGCADTGGNAYTNHAFRGNNATGAAGVVGGIFATKATVALAVSNTITVTLSGAVTQKAIYAESFIGFDNTLRNAVVVASGATTTASVTSGSATSGDLVVGAVAIESRTAPSAYDTDTSNGTWSTGFVKPSNTSGSDATLVEIVGQYKVVTATGAQTYNLTNVNTDWAAMVAIFQATP